MALDSLLSIFKPRDRVFFFHFEASAANVLKMSDAIARVKPVYLDIEPGKDGWPADLFRNLNAPSDL